MNTGLARNKTAIGLLLCLLTAAAYWPVTRCGFVDFDDSDYVTENLKVQDGLTLDGLVWAFSTRHSANWHPVTWLSHMLDAQLYGLEPAGHHLTNLLFHLANTVLLFLLFARMTGATWRSALVAALFGLHPTHVESVAWVSERKDVLSTFFFLLTLLAYVRYARGRQTDAATASGNPQTSNLKLQGSFKNQAPGSTDDASRSTLFYFLSLLFFALGLMSKPMLVTLPFVLLLLDYWPLGRMASLTSDGSKVKPQGAAASVSLPWSSLNRSSLLPLLLEKIPFLLLSAASSVLTFFVQHTGGATVSTAELSVGGRVANVLVAYVRYIGKSIWPTNLAVFYPRPLEWPLWQVACAALILLVLTTLVLRLWARKPYLPVGWFWFLGTLVPVIGLVQVGEQAMADRYTYIPFIGLFVVISWGLAEIVGQSAGARKIAVTASGCALALLLALTWHQTLQWRTTETLFRQAVAATEDNAMAQDALGSALSAAGNPDEAERHCLEALRIKPDFAEAEVTYGLVLARLGRLDEARSRLSSVLARRPKDAFAHFNLAYALNLSGDTAKAIEQYREGLQLKPIYPDAINNLAWIRAAHPDPTFRNGAEAVQLAQQACELTRYRRPIMVGTLAAAYAEAGRFDDAVATAQKAHDLAIAQDQKDIAAKNQKLLELYRAHQPYHEPVQSQP